MTLEIVGREEELASIHTFIDQAEGRAAALVLEGEPGIGKSTLWAAGVEHARERGMRVLDTRPAEAERGLAHAGLGDLFEDVLVDVLPRLPTPRRRALEVALLVEEATGDPVDRRALAVAVRGALEVLSEGGPLVIAVDDVQWLDPSSSDALTFAFRRLDDQDVLLLMSRRFVDGSQAPELESAFEADRLQRVNVGPLSAGALHRLLRDRLDRTFPRQTLLRIHERSGGNPFFALEVARRLETDVDPLEPLPVPETLEELVQARLTGLPRATREGLGLASAWGATSDELLERAGVSKEALEPAIAANVIERHDGAIRFTHPLLSSVLYADLGDGRRAVHGRIAEIADDPVARARHLALSRKEPDADVAVTLDEAAVQAADRGAAALAAELAEQALRLTPADELDERDRRTLSSARAHQDAGEWTHARALAAGLAESESDSVRAGALVLLSELESIEDSIPLLEEALRVASEPAQQVVVRVQLAWAVRFRDGFVKSLERAREALELAGSIDHASQVRALTAVAELGAFVGDQEAPALAARALELAVDLGEPELEYWATAAVASGLIFDDDKDSGRRFVEDAYTKWRERDEQWSARALWALSLIELDAGNWELAAEHAALARDVAVQYGIEVPQHYLPIAWIAVHRGQLEFARETSQRALALAKEHFGLHPPYHLAVIGLAAFWSGDVSTGAEWLSRAHTRALELGWFEPANRPWTGDCAEALLELGRIEEAEQVLGGWEAEATRLGRQRVLAHVARGRGLIAAARGEVDAAVTLLEGATARHEELGDLYGHSRALLALGVLRRRARQKRPARDAIVQALGGFEELGAATWIAKARAELGSIGGRTRDEGLTPAEQRVAALVAEGRTNREVAAALFLGERTVASHLTHIYAKLGIRSRTELARVLPEAARKVQTF